MTSIDFDETELIFIRQLVKRWWASTPGEWVRRRAMLVKLGARVEPLGHMLVPCPRADCFARAGEPCDMHKAKPQWTVGVQRTKPFVHSERQADAVTLLSELGATGSRAAD